MESQLIFLGTGNAWGIPEIDCGCIICDKRRQEKAENEKTGKPTKENRLRTSLFFKNFGGLNTLIDCGPDFREQYERYICGEKIDNILMTHQHFDHAANFDDLYPICRNLRKKKPIPVYATEDVWNSLEKKFHYLLDNTLQKRVVKPEEETLLSEGLSYTAIEMEHGPSAKGNVGYVLEDKCKKKRIGYTSDFRCVKGSHKNFMGLDILVGETNWFNEPLDNNASHMSLQHLLDYIRVWKPKITYCTHFSCRDVTAGIHPDVPTTVEGWDAELEKRRSEEGLPPILASYDGLKIEI